LTFLHCLTGVGVNVGLVAMNISDAAGKYEVSASDARVEFGRSADTVDRGTGRPEILVARTWT
jgi:hypothetical protein